MIKIANCIFCFRHVHNISHNKRNDFVLMVVLLYFYVLVAFSVHFFVDAVVGSTFQRHVQEELSISTAKSSQFLCCYIIFLILAYFHHG
jgi:hypothetical protein